MFQICLFTIYLEGGRQYYNEIKSNFILIFICKTSNVPKFHLSVDSISLQVFRFDFHFPCQSLTCEVFKRPSNKNNNRRILRYSLWIAARKSLLFIIIFVSNVHYSCVSSLPCTQNKLFFYSLWKLLFCGAFEKKKKKTRTLYHSRDCRSC